MVMISEIQCTARVLFNNIERSKGNRMDMFSMFKCYSTLDFFKFYPQVKERFPLL